MFPRLQFIYRQFSSVKVAGKLISLLIYLPKVIRLGVTIVSYKYSYLCQIDQVLLILVKCNKTFNYDSCFSFCLRLVRLTFFLYGVDNSKQFVTPRLQVTIKNSSCKENATYVCGHRAKTLL